MKLSRHILLLTVCFLFHAATAFAQPGFKVDIEKPKPYTQRKLKAEKTGEGKMKPVKRIWQNLTTHYNYVFNANNKMAEVLDRAKEQHRDDYSALLTFYNYELDVTAADSAQLDSIIYKARTGILNHDLRSEWADELYLLWAQSWHLQKKFDSASLMLQFINYSFAPQYDDGFYKYIGSNTDGAKELSIVTKEEKHFLHNNTFSRNNAFIWQIRNRIEMGDFTTAGSLITTLRRDPAFPKRLDNPLHEAEAYYYYAQKQWDSSAVHLLAAIDDGDYSKLEKARWTYLAGQLMERSGKTDEALKLYEKVVTTAPDPVMEVYARLNLVRLSKEGGEKAIDNNLTALLKMAKKDKYEDYRDIIYYMAAQMELERNNIAAATELLIKGSKFNNGNAASRNKAYLQIADALFDQKKYIQSAPFYDSLEIEALTEAQAARVSERMPPLQKLVFNSAIIYRQDSLQRIAAMPEEERNALIKKTLKRLRKEKGLKEEPVVASSGGNLLPFAANNQPADLFPTEQKGEWYFYNSNAKSQGTAQFKSTWGNRPNVDNWRRYAVVNQQILSSPDKVVDAVDPDTPSDNEASSGNDLSFEALVGRLPTTPEAIQTSNDSIRNALFTLGKTYLNEIEDYPTAIATFEELRRRFPDSERMDEVLFNLYYAYSKAGNASAAAQIKKLLSDQYPSSRFTAIASTGKDPEATTKTSPEATRAYENVYNLFIEGKFTEAEKAKRIADSTYKTNFWEPQLLYIEAVYYIKQRQDSMATDVLGTIVGQNTNKALTEKAQNLISVLSRRKEIEDELTRLQITRPSEDDTATKQPVAYQKPPEKKDTVEAKPVQKPATDSIALAKAAQKRIADSLARAALTAKQLRDSLDKAKRDSIALAKQQAVKALQDSLTHKALVDKQRRDSLALAKQQAAQALRDSLEKKALVAKQKRDSLALAKAAQEQAKRDSLALAKAIKDQARDSLALSKYLAKRRLDSLARITSDSLALVKKQAAQALRDSLARKALANKQRLDSLALAKENAAKAKKDSLALQALIKKQKSDSIALAKAAREQARQDSIALSRAAKRLKDSLDLANKPPAKKPVDTVARKPVSPLGYTFNPEEPHYAVVVLEKVDPIFVNEAKNAFDRYNKESYYGQPLDVQILNVTADTRLLLINGLVNAKTATDYVTKTKPLAPTEIVPWLTGNKYTFSIISAPNLEILRAKGDMSAYKKFLEQVLPGKF